MFHYIKLVEDWHFVPEVEILDDEVGVDAVLVALCDVDVLVVVVVGDVDVSVVVLVVVVVTLVVTLPVNIIGNVLYFFKLKMFFE
jgi:hypothetical protein